ncbi:MAG TPA: purine nucleoside permease [Opitutaceae bacterium]|jgi:purine nucleoside permease
MAAVSTHGAEAPIPIKVVVVTTFEEDYQNPAATGESPGEAARWIHGYRLDRIVPVPAGFRPARVNADGVMEYMTGMTTGKAAASTMALGLDPRFDLTHAYWIMAGIAGVDPMQAAQGSAVWTEWIVDGDIDCLIDPREIPPNWPDGHVPWNGSAPTDPPFIPKGQNVGQVYHLDRSLVNWAYGLTSGVKLVQTDAERKFAGKFPGFAGVQKGPRVLIGDNLSSATYWQGTLGTEWARRWVKLYTDGKGTFATSSCEDSGFLQAITLLGKSGRIDPKRVLDLRTASDYTVPHPGMTSAQSLNYDGPNAAYMADKEAFDSAYQVGRVVVDELVRHWDKYRNSVP